MPLARQDAICLRAYPFGETSQIVSLLCRDLGVVRMIAKGARRRTKVGKTKFDGGIDLLDGGHALFAHVEDRELSVMTEWKLLDDHRDLRRNLRSLQLGLYCADMVEALVEQHDPHPKLYDGMTRMLHRLTVPADREAVAVAFVLNLIRQVGLLPDFGRTADGTATRLALEEGDVVTFSPEQAALYTGDAVPGDAEVVDAEGLQLILALLRLSRTGEALPEVEARVASAAHRLLVAHVRYQTEGRIKSARAVLRAA